MRLSHEVIPDKLPYKVVVIYGRDWSSDRGPQKADYPFRAYYTWVAGLLIKEEDEFLCIAQDYCPETGNVREVWTIPKNTILKRYDFEAPE